MVIQKYLNFYSIIFIKNLQIYPKHYDKEYGVLGIDVMFIVVMVKIEFLEVKIQDLTKCCEITPFHTFGEGNPEIVLRSC